MKKAVILLSGGLDSATCLAIAKSQGYECHALSFDYGQRHQIELKCAENVARHIGVVNFLQIKFDMSLWGGSALTDSNIAVPNADPNNGEKHIPVTYVPARNTIFLSFACSYAEVIGARDIFIGVNSKDYSGYPDCRPQFIEAFRKCATLGTKACDEGWEFKIQTPLQNLRKAEIIQRGLELGFDYSLTHSCYNPEANGKPCGKCDSCRLRNQAFAELGMTDPALDKYK